MLDSGLAVLLTRKFSEVQIIAKLEVMLYSSFGALHSRDVVNVSYNHTNKAFMKKKGNNYF